MLALLGAHSGDPDILNTYSLWMGSTLDPLSVHNFCALWCALVSVFIVLVQELAVVKTQVFTNVFLRNCF